MTVICRIGHRKLYEDFADEIIEIEIPGNNINMWKGSINVESIISYYKQKGEFTDFIPFDSFKTRWWLDSNQRVLQEFIPYGSLTLPVGATYTGFDILMHVRNAYHCRTAFRNWKQDNARAYAEWATSKGFFVACIGRSQTALHIKGTIDLRDVFLERLVHVMASSRLIIGSQSSPHHLACLCRLPVIAWQTKREHVVRLTKYWNPFAVKCITNPAPDIYWEKRKRCRLKS